MFRIRRNHKDVLFVRLFRDKKALLSLYNALNGSDYTDENELYIHGEKLIPLPKPGYVIFYNGTEEHGEAEELRLSDSFGGDDSCLELRATMYNINYGHNEELMGQCKTLSDYAYFISRIRYYNTKKSYSIKKAVDTACMECISKGILRDFLLKNRSEVMDMFMVDYYPNLQRKMDREEGYEDGFADGEASGFTKGSRQEKEKNDRKMRQIVKNMIQRDLTDGDIRAMAECDQCLIDEVRKSLKK